jgi:hypothetical protein
MKPKQGTGKRKGKRLHLARYEEIRLANAGKLSARVSVPLEIKDIVWYLTGNKIASLVGKFEEEGLPRLTHHLQVAWKLLTARIPSAPLPYPSRFKMCRTAYFLRKDPANPASKAHPSSI